MPSALHSLLEGSRRSIAGMHAWGASGAVAAGASGSSNCSIMVKTSVVGYLSITKSWI